MPSRAQLETALINADAAGDHEAAVQLATALKSGQYDKQENQPSNDLGVASNGRAYTAPLADTSGIGQGIAAFAEPALTVGTGALGSVVGGLVGLAETPFAGAEKGAATSQAIQNSMTYQPRTQGGQEGLGALQGAMESPYNPLNVARDINQYTGASDKLAENGFPMAATALNVGGDLLAGLGISKVVKAAIPAKIASAETPILAQQTEAPKVQPITGVDQSQTPLIRPDETRISTLADAFANSGMKDRINTIVGEIKLNPDRVKAAELMGVDAPVATLSDDGALHAISGALAAAPGSKARSILTEYNKELTTRAEDLIKGAGGELDKGLVNKQLQDSMDGAITTLKNQSGDIYKAIDEAVPKDTIVNTKPLIRELNRRGSNSQQGIAGLSKVEQDVYNKIQGKPTYFDIDNLRKDIGDSIGGLKGSYGDANSATLKDLYAKLSQMQEGVADAVSKNGQSKGAGDLWREAKALDVQRFKLQDHSEFLFGKDLNSAVIPKVELGLKQLAKGDPKNFSATINAVPEEYRQKIVVSGLNGLMQKTMQGEREFNPAQFNSWYGELSSSPTNKKILHDYLPEGAGDRLDAIFKLSQGLQNVTSKIKETGIVNDAFKNFDKNGGLIDRLYNTADKVDQIPVVGSMVGAPAVRVASNIMKMAVKEKTPAVKAADELLADPSFKTAVLDYQKSGKIDSSAQENLKKAESYKKYLDAQDSARKILIEKNGIVPFLVSGEDENK